LIFTVVVNAAMKSFENIARARTGVAA
jgi:hypothetical protein